MAIPVVILAGGEGRRIGGEKPLRVLGGKCLIAHALDRAHLYSGEVRVSVAADSQLAELGAMRLFDDPAGMGPLGGLRAAFRYAADKGHDAVLTIPCDTPFLPVNLLARLSEALTPAFDAAIASSAGQIHPSCGLWRTSLLSDLEAYLGTDRRAVSGLLHADSHAVVEWPVDPYDPFFNINRAEDLVRAEALLQGMPAAKQ